jgi:hypothetical protein
MMPQHSPRQQWQKKWVRVLFLEQRSKGLRMLLQHGTAPIVLIFLGTQMAVRAAACTTLKDSGDPHYSTSWHASNKYRRLGVATDRVKVNHDFIGIRRLWWDETTHYGSCTLNVFYFLLLMKF